MTSKYHFHAPPPPTTHHFVNLLFDLQKKKKTPQEKEIDGYFANGFAIATQSQSSIESSSDNIQSELSRAGPTRTIEWSSCLACALIDRQHARNGLPRTGQCENCFRTYCAEWYVDHHIVLLFYFSWLCAWRVWVCVCVNVLGYSMWDRIGLYHCTASQNWTIRVHKPRSGVFFFLRKPRIPTTTFWR